MKTLLRGAALAVAGALLSACVPVAVQAQPGVEPAETSTTTTAAAAGSPLSTLRTVETMAVGYQRDEFGSGWVDPAGPTCDTRQQVLGRDLTDTTTTRYCYLATGTLKDRYSGRTITGPTRDLDIDHVVALADAWRTGANEWAPEQRVAFANDLRNLVATSASANRSKGDQGPDEWSPLSKAGACWYARQYVAVKAVYELGVTAQQREALESTLAACEG